MARSLVETAAVSELGGGNESEFIGIDPEAPGNTLIGWSAEGLRMVALMQGRTVAAFPIASRYERPAEVDLLIGDPAKARKKLGWTPKVTFAELAKLMVDADMKTLQDQLAGKVNVAQ